MKCRIWRTGVIEGRAADYERFARDISLPMFRAQAGFRGVVMARDGGDCLVITLWADQDAIDALDGSSSYRDTVRRIVDAGFLTGEQSVAVLDAHLMALDGAQPASEARS